MFSGTSISQWLMDNVVIVMLIIAGISILIASINKKPRDAMIVFGLSILGMFLLVAASSWQQIGQWVNGILGGA